MKLARRKESFLEGDRDNPSLNNLDPSQWHTQRCVEYAHLPELLSDIWKRPVARPPTCLSSSELDCAEALLSESESLPAAQNLLLMGLAKHWEHASACKTYLRPSYYKIAEGVCEPSMIEALILASER